MGSESNSDQNKEMVDFSEIHVFLIFVICFCDFFDFHIFQIDFIISRRFGGFWSNLL